MAGPIGPAFQFGGERDTPIDEPASAAEDKTVYFQKQAYTPSEPGLFPGRSAAKSRRDYRHMTTTLSLDLQNLTGTKNIYDQEYDPFQGKVVDIYQPA